MTESNQGGLVVALGMLVVFGALMTIAIAGSQAPAVRTVYPVARTVDVVDDYHGIQVHDPYRWLEDTDSAETAAWVDAENRLTFSYLEGVPVRERVRARLRELWNHERWGVPVREGERTFYTRNDGLQNQAVLCWAETLDAAPRVLLDPNALSTDGTVALAGWSVSDDGKLLAYGLARSGSDWEEWRVRDVATGQDLPDALRWIKFSGASWDKAGQGFYYSRYDEPKGAELKEANYYQKLCYHRIGTPQSADTIVYRRDDEKEWGFGAQVSDDGKYLIVSIGKGTDPRNQVLYWDLEHGGASAPSVPLVEGFEHGWQFVGNDGPVLFFETDLDAPRGRIVAIDTRSPGATDAGPHPRAAGGLRTGALREVVPQAREAIQGVSLVGGQLVVTYLQDAHTRVELFDLSGKHVRTLELPGLGSASGFAGKQTDKETFFDYTDYTTPAKIYRLDVESGKATIWRQPQLAFDPAAYESKQVFYTSKDGTRVPMTIVSRRGLALTGDHPTLLYAYGGFDDAETPWFSPATIAWLELGGVYAVANIRGGGEYGEEWHQAGKREKKQNVFDDFIAAAEWLIANRYTRTERLAIEGASNGGLLIGACLTQRPDLFGAAVPEVGVMDMLRFHKFTIGWAWTDEYGCSDDPRDFAFLRAYSPYHNVKPGTRYPATLVLTADHDDRVVPGHSFKFAAALQAAQAGPAPILIRVETKAGHGAGKPISKEIEVLADEYGFLAKALGMTEPAR